jgi:tetratricopeptide (TPR) repeat protein
MTGVYTDNQPDFTWLKPYEEKTFRQYFMPYKAVGQVKNATIDAAVNLEVKEHTVHMVVYATGVHQAEITLRYEGKEIYKKAQRISPTEIFEDEIAAKIEDGTKLSIEVTEEEKVLVSYKRKKQEIEKLPNPAEAIGEPETITTNEELYLAGLHIEQYRHATYLPDPYYLEGLKRDPGDIRINNAYGMLLFRRGCFAEAKPYLKKAIERLTKRNPNPYDSEAYYNLGLAHFYLGEKEDAYDAFFKATWSNEQQEMSFYYLAEIDAERKNYEHALEMVKKALVKNAHNMKARGLYAYILRKLQRVDEAKLAVAENIRIDPFDFLSRYEQILLVQGEAKHKLDELLSLMRNFYQNYLMIARDYAEFGAFEEAIQILLLCKEESPMIKYYEAFYWHKEGDEEKAKELIGAAERTDSSYCFPNKLEDIAVLEFASRQYNAGMAAYYLGNLYFDKLQWKRAIALWERAREQYPQFATVHRNLALAYYNKCSDKVAAKTELEKAFELNMEDARVFLELDQLYKKLNYSFKDRLLNYEQHMDVIEKRDDLFIEYITLCNMVGEHRKAYELCMSRHFHAWEGGEGKVTTQYVLALLSLARKALSQNNPKEAEDLLRKALVYPQNLGEGKLEGTKDNHIFYYLGVALEMQGKAEDAKFCFETAATGTDEPAGMMYYNDQPADMIMYQGLAKKKLGESAKSKARFYRLIDYGEKHLWDDVKIEYFAVSLPEFQIFDEDYTTRNKAHCYYLMALGNLGLGKKDMAKKFLNLALELEPSHMMATIYSNVMLEDNHEVFVSEVPKISN